MVRQQCERREGLVRRRRRPRFEKPLFDSYLLIGMAVRRDHGVSHHVHENRAAHVVRHLAAAIHAQARDLVTRLRPAYLKINPSRAREERASEEASRFSGVVYYRTPVNMPGLDLSNKST